jgi:hypothetical protein
MCTEPVNYSADPLLAGCEPLRVTLIVCESPLEASWGAPDPEAALAWRACGEAEASRKSDMTVAASSFISVYASIQCLTECSSRGWPAINHPLFTPICHLVNDHIILLKEKGR